MELSSDKGFNQKSNDNDSWWLEENDCFHFKWNQESKQPQELGK